MRSMFPTYQFPARPGNDEDDESEETSSDWHLCQEDRYKPPVSDPGPWPEPTRADRWDVSRLAEPTLDALGMPSAPEAPFQADLTEKASAPLVDRHYMHRFTNRPVDYPNRDDRNWGELDDFALVIKATLVPKPKPKIVEKKVEQVEEVKQSNWKLETSIFAPRKKEADARNFWNSDKFLKKMVAADWKRLGTLQRFENLVKRMGGEAADEALSAGLTKLYRSLLNVFDHYAIMTELDPFDMSMGSWIEFCNDAGGPSGRLTSACPFRPRGRRPK